MPMKIELGEVVSNGALAKDIYIMQIHALGIADDARPGQFVNILVNDSTRPLFRRPMSVAAAGKGRIELVYKVFGAGTAAMSAWEPGHQVDVLGPLGNGWLPVENTLPILVGGGAGIAPIRFLHLSLLDRKIDHRLIIGARTAAEHFLAHEPGKGIVLTTDDDSAGIRGTVMAGLAQVLDQLAAQPVTLFGCGPEPMLAALKTFTAQKDIPCQLAIEELMACGFGLCQGCSVQVHSALPEDSSSYRQRFKLVCMDGPVFWAHDLV